MLTLMLTLILTLILMTISIIYPFLKKDKSIIFFLNSIIRNGVLKNEFVLCMMLWKHKTQIELGGQYL